MKILIKQGYRKRKLHLKMHIWHITQMKPFSIELYILYEFNIYYGCALYKKKNRVAYFTNSKNALIAKFLL